MRSVELAVYADSLAAEAAALAARVERARAALCRAAIEQEAAATLPAAVVGRLRALGLLRGAPAGGAGELERLDLDLRAVLQLQAWVEGQLARSRDSEPPASLRGIPQTAA